MTTTKETGPTARIHRAIRFNNEGVHHLQNQTLSLTVVTSLARGIQLLRLELANMKKKNCLAETTPDTSSNDNNNKNSLPTSAFGSIEIIELLQPSSISSNMVSHAMHISRKENTSTTINEHNETQDEENEVVLRFYSAVVIYNLALAHHLWYLRSHSNRPTLMERAKALYPMALQVLSSARIGNEGENMTSKFSWAWSVLQVSCSINVVQLHQEVHKSVSLLSHFDKYYSITLKAMRRLSDLDEDQNHQQPSLFVQRLFHLAHLQILCQRPTTNAPSA